MKNSRYLHRFGILAFAFLAASCMDDSGSSEKPPAGNSKASGYFRITLVEPTDIVQGVPTFDGRVFAGPVPSAFGFEKTQEIGGCTLYKTKTPHCDISCGSGAMCVSDGVCKDFPKSISVGKVTLTGAKTKAGTASVSMDPVLNNYAIPASVALEKNPFGDGDQVTVAAAGDTALGSFSVSAQGISRLELKNDSIALADGQPIPLRWTPPAKAIGSKVTVKVDLSHHGGIKGKIECETEDDGSLDIDAKLVDGLKALGVSGFPYIEVARQSVGIHSSLDIDFEIQSPITKGLTIPGVISCNGDEECPGTLKCQPDFQCK